MLWSWTKKLHNMGRIYSWYVSGGTIKIKINEDGDFVSLTHTDDFIKHFLDVDFTAFHNRKQSITVKVSLLVSPFKFRTVFIYDFPRIYWITCEILIRHFFFSFLFSRYFDKLGLLFAIKKFVYFIVSCELSFVNFSGQLWLSNFIY